MGRSRRASGFKIAIITSIVLVIGLLLLYISMPISTTYLVGDVKTTQSSMDYRADFLKLTNQRFGAQNPYANFSQRQAVVQVALAEANAGVKEIGGNTNDIKYNDWYCGGKSDYDQYCARFVMWCFDKIGMYVKGSTKPPWIDSARCTVLASKYTSYGRFVLATSDYEPRPGDIIIFTKFKSNAGASDGTSNVPYVCHHTGIVVDSDEKNVYTVEGNTDSGNSVGSVVNGAGAGVYVKKRPKPISGQDSQIYGYCVPWYDGEEEFATVNGEIF